MMKNKVLLHLFFILILVSNCSKDTKISKLESDSGLNDSFEWKSISLNTLKKSTFLNPIDNKLTNIHELLKLENLSVEHRIYVHFWATWCVPCLDELPALVQYVDDVSKLKGEKNELFLIAVDDRPEKVNEFIRKKGINLRDSVLLYDNNEESYLKYGVSKVPETFVFNPKGQVIQKFVGPQKWLP